MLSNLAVAREVGKQVYIAERLAPPTSVAEVQTAYRQLFSSASSLAWWRSTLESGEWKRVGIYALEAYGIFRCEVRSAPKTSAQPEREQHRRDAGKAACGTFCGSLGRNPLIRTSGAIGRLQIELTGEMPNATCPDTAPFTL